MHTHAHTHMHTLSYLGYCFLFLLLRAMKVATIATIATINPAPPRMPARRARRREGVLVGVAVVGSVTVLEDTDALMVPPTVVVMVGITAVIDEREAVDMLRTLNCIG